MLIAQNVVPVYICVAEHTSFDTSLLFPTQNIQNVNFETL